MGDYYRPEDDDYKYSPGPEFEAKENLRRQLEEDSAGFAYQQDLREWGLQHPLTEPEPVDPHAYDQEIQEMQEEADRLPE